MKLIVTEHTVSTALHSIPYRNSTVTGWFIFGTLPLPPPGNLLFLGHFGTMGILVYSKIERLIRYKLNLCDGLFIGVRRQPVLVQKSKRSLVNQRSREWEQKLLLFLYCCVSPC